MDLGGCQRKGIFLTSLPNHAKYPRQSDKETTPTQNQKSKIAYEVFSLAGSRKSTMTKGYASEIIFLILNPDLMILEEYFSIADGPFGG